MKERDGAESTERGEAVLAIFQRGAEFTRQLLEENARLRRELGALELRHGQAAQCDTAWEKLRQELISKIEDLESRNHDILEQLRHVESESQLFAERYREVEEENSHLAALYVATYQLHSTLDPAEVVRVIVEIVINLIGGEVFAVYVAEDDARVLEPVAAEGAPLAEFPRHRMGDGFVGGSVASGRVEVGPAAKDAGGPVPGRQPVVSIPLRVDEHPVGAIVIYDLLRQKDGFSPLDHELFSLLAGHAATAICAARLHAQSERKLSTIQGFIDLLTK
ncbi:MAG: GAF domain-containing protein [Spirochaetaceae bacterium]|nr:GAF domain-containing protein [Myxococcales bacterium]MCB9723476.1 GAF domain-containing protein [Spirochaetaceae bacterium]HPG28479.1 GAF domain-containing protein [Myxococcota bacterium]